MPIDEKRLRDASQVHLPRAPRCSILARMNAMPRPVKASSKPTGTGASLPPVGGAGRISPALRDAIELKVRTGQQIKAICEHVGIHEATWFNAMKRPHVLEHMQNVQMQYIQEVDALKAGYTAQAYTVAADLMWNAKSEAIRMRAVEFFAGKPSAPTVNVQVNNSAPGYTYARPVNRPSTSDSAQPIEIEGKATEV